MSARKMPVGLVMRGEDGGRSIVLDWDNPSSPVEALADMLYEAYGVKFDSTDERIVAAAEKVKVDVWHSTTKRWREAEGVGDLDEDWYAPHGDGKRAIRVAWYPDSLYVLGDPLLNES